MHAFSPALSIRKLFAIFVALAVLFAPAASRATAAIAGVSDHELMMEQTGHCRMPSGSADHRKGADKTCCISMCMAATVNDLAPSADEFFTQITPVPMIPTLHIGCLGDIATPPPRLA